MNSASPSLSIIELAKLSLHVYKDKKTIAQMIPGYVKPPLYEDDFISGLNTYNNGFYEVIIDEFYQSTLAENHPFYASLYVKIQHKKPVAAVIAIRGTDNFENGVQDVKSWWKSFFNDDASINVPNYYLHRTNFFYIKVRAFIQKIGLSLHQCEFTGHSLGGAIAALMPTYAGIPVHATTFNAPGVKAISGVKNFYHRVTNIRSTYDFVSAINFPIGPQYDYLVPEMVDEAKLAFAIAKTHEEYPLTRLDFIGDQIEEDVFFASVISQHKMANLLRQVLKQKSVMSDLYCRSAG